MGEENITSNIHLHDDQAEDAEETLSLCDLALDFDADNNPSNIHLHDDQAEEAREKLSLCELALDLDAHSNNNPENHLENMPRQSRRSSSVAAPEFFEFLSDLSSDMCPADDMIFCGKLIPLEQSGSFQKRNDCPSDERTKNRVLRKRSESLSDLHSRSIIRSDSTKNTKVLRNSRSLDHQKRHRQEMERNPSIRSAGKSEVSSPKKAVKPRWYVFMFGLVKFPREMELKDIKSRQFQHSSSAIFPPELLSKKSTGNRSSGKSSSWSVLNALSCMDHSSVAVKASYCMPQA